MWAYGLLTDVRDFLEVGGGVLVLISFAIVAMWSMIFERFWFFRRVHMHELQRTFEEWDPRGDRSSTRALQIRRMLISRLRHGLERRLSMIQVLIKVCPLLGLLGTLLGMIEVFEVTALSGGGNIRAIASGVSKATITTMAGMVAALSGLVTLAVLERIAHEEGERAEALMVIYDSDPCVS